MSIGTTYTKVHIQLKYHKLIFEYSPYQPLFYINFISRQTGSVYQNSTATINYLEYHVYRCEWY